MSYEVRFCPNCGHKIFGSTHSFSGFTLTSFECKACRWSDALANLPQYSAGDQELLAETAKTAKDRQERLFAVERLTDQRKLAEVACLAPYGEETWDMGNQWWSLDTDAGKVAIERLTDQRLLAEIARTNQDKRKRQDATLKLTDQTTIAEIAKKGSKAEAADDAILTAASAGDRILAMKLYRDRYCVSLAEAKRFVDELLG